jgi:anaerobic selenocysteine-containing dehydrogenase
VPWADWVADYASIRDAIARSFPDIFHNFNARLKAPGGFHRPIAARKRRWNTPTKKANFVVPTCLDADPDMAAPDGADILRLMTLRSNDQFNTTVYGYNDRFRGIRGTRSVILLGAGDMKRLGLAEGDIVNAWTVADDATRTVHGLRVTRYDIPAGCAAAYYPECNALIPLWHHAKGSCVPAAKSIPIRLRRASSP